MTLAEVLPAAQQLSPGEKLKLIQILSEDLNIDEDISPLQPFKTYSLPTPYDCYGAGAALMAAFQRSDAAPQ
jgi:hypothetical protein